MESNINEKASLPELTKKLYLRKNMNRQYVISSF